jgi:DtxR family Mn-dependent transcriptional regulator
MPTQTVEDYLKRILSLQGEGGEASVGDLARHLQVTSGTVTTMVKRLTAQKLVASKRYGGIRLTGKGERLAMAVLRRHRIIETFLVRTLGMDWAEVHEEAERLEHAMSDRLLDRIDELLGRPDVDPHGDPIPTAQGAVADQRLVSLSVCKPGKRTRIGRILDQDASFLRFIDESGLRPGESIVIEATDLNADSIVVAGPIGRQITLSTRAAAKILVER